MTLAHGRHLMIIPGPSVMPDRVLRAMHQAAPNIYEGALVDATADIVRWLKDVARTRGGVAIYVANGHGGWDAALTNVLMPGEKALVVSTGRFALGWGEMAEAMGIDIEILDCGSQAPASPQQLEDRLRADQAGEIKVVLSVHTDTSSSVRNDIAALRNAIDTAGHNALLAVDCIASLGCEPFEMDAWGVDIMVAASQKGLMTPPGLAFNFVSDKAIAARQALPRVGRYFDWIPRIRPQFYYQHFCGTAPTHHLLGLHEALTMIKEEGLENTWARHRALAEVVWSAVSVWSELGALRFHVPDPAHRSTAVTTIRTTTGDAPRLRKWCEDQAGVTLGIGLNIDDGKAASGSEELFRIGHMGHLSPAMLMGGLGVIDAGLKANGIDHGGGALRVAAETLARVA